MRRLLPLALSLAAAACGSTPAPDAGGDVVDVQSPVDGTVTPQDGGADARADSAVDAIPRPDVVIPDAASCPSPVPDDPHASARTMCMYGAGARVADTIGDVSAARSALTHVIVVMQENRSMDHMFGQTGHGIEGWPSTFTNPDPDGNPLAPFHLTTACTRDPPHQWSTMHQYWDDGLMDGFAQYGGPDAMGYFTDADHPFYTWMATTFAVSDRYFASVMGGTWPNRDYMLLGTADGVRITYVGTPRATLPTLMTRLDDAHVTWGEYVANGDPWEGSLGWALDHAGVHPYDEFLPALAAGTIPHVTFVDFGDGLDEHPASGSVHNGEAAVRELVAAALQSPLWAHLAVVVTYDEGGGFFDHVPPPTACIADPAREADVDHFGFRVPLLIASPWVRPGYVSHRTSSHTSITRLIEALYDLPALTPRDANSDALLDMFDFQCPTFLTPPSTVPAAGSGSPPNNC